MAKGKPKKTVTANAEYLQDGEALYVVWSRFGLAPEIDPEWYEHFAAEGMCSGCDCVDKRYAPRSIDVVLVEQPQGIGLSDGYLKVLYWPLLQLLLPHMAEYVLGDVYVRTSDGQVQSPEYRTCYPLPSTEIVYCGDDMPDEQCKVCSRWLYQWVEGIKIARSSVPDRPVVQDIFWNTWLRPSVVRSIDWSRFPDAFLEEVRITSE